MRTRVPLRRLLVMFAALAALIGMVTAGSAPAQAQQVPAQTGSTPPRRIISMVPSLTEVLYAIGAGPQVVAVSAYDHFPTAVTTLPTVGGLLDPNTERILALRPDLVVTYGSQDDLERRLRTAGIPTFTFRHGDIAGVRRACAELGRVTGHEAEAAAAVARLDASIAALRQRLAGRPRPRTLVVFGRESGSLRQLYAAAGRGFMQELVALAGGANVFADVDRESVQPSTETLLARAPEVVVELHAGDAPSAEQQAREADPWRVLASVPAVRARRVHLLYGAYLTIPGPRLAQAAEAIARVIQPDAFR